MATALDDEKPPITLDEIYTRYRDDLVQLAWVVMPWMCHDDLEDYVHDFYIHESRRKRIGLWDGRCKLSSWLMTTMRWYHGNICKPWQADRPLYDMSRPWTAWCDSTSVQYDIPIQIREYQLRYPEHRETLEHLLSDKSLIALDKWRSQAHRRVEEMRHDMQADGGLLETGDGWHVDGRVVQDMLAAKRYGFG